MRTSIPFKPLAAVIALSLGGLVAVPAVSQPAGDAVPAATRKTYLIEFDEPGTLYYDGGMGSLSATAPRTTGAQVFDARSAEARAYVSHLENTAAMHTAAIGAALGRSLTVTHKYFYTHSGIAAALTEEEAAEAARVPGVKSVTTREPDVLATYRTPALIGAETVWSLPSPGGTTNRGAGVRIAVLDSGANSQHPAFANDAACGFSVANPKLVAISCATATGPGGACNGPNPEADATSSSHGVHVAGTAAGNVLVAASTTPAPTLPAPYTQLSGMAPCAGVNSYKVCNEPDGRCAGADSAAAINGAIAAVADGVRVINFSISGGTSPWSSSDNDRRFLDAVNAGIFVAAAAGNTRTETPDPVGQVNHRGPWVLSVANTYATVRPLGGRFSVDGPAAVDGLEDLPVLKGSTTPVGSAFTAQPLRIDPANLAGCTNTGGFAAGYFTGAVAVVRRGANTPATEACGFAEKVTNAVNAGATAVLVVNNQYGALSMNTAGAPTTAPSYSLADQPQGDRLIALIRAGAVTGRLDVNAELTDMLSPGSLRGPTPGTLADLTKPDAAAPGTDIYAPMRTADGSYDYMSGTSMASPHVAGSGALLRAIHPTWTPMEVKSALQMTAVRPGGAWWDGDGLGNGRIDVSLAERAGLVMDETYANFVAANPSGGTLNIKQLNLPSMRNVACTPSCTFTRTVRSTLATASNWAVTFETAADITAVVTPASFTLAPGATQTLQITVSVDASGRSLMAPSMPGFGAIVLTEAGGLSPPEHLSVAVRGVRDHLFTDGFDP
ncbi:S8 family serine peptidase [Dokdonella koreensis]|uniref:Peptidase S8 and S53 subtilisin kexin sedolisin n=1 Tax=Dokdonella koreensis DS-123 TaxID=1300342 RepID=A0A167GVI3_9GAMM|nr:S8 family serine peptidase [Dokdonella koreensis]ANB17802.1 Peptidase S8 and S53 subtilisin kexin sedolisin [Dokdonella koreensis DS-123]